MTPLLRAAGLGKRYRRRWALRGCTLDIPAGHVTGLVGPNGAGKSTLLGLAVALDTPVYAGLTVAEHLRLGAHLNPRWDAAVARSRIEQLGLDPGQKAGKLSGGQRAQLALTLGLAKRPQLLVLDEPVASLDPLARREFLQELMAAVAEQEISVLLSSHVVSDLERVCDHLIVLVDSEVRVEGDVETLLAQHHRLTGPRRDTSTLPAGQQVVSASSTDRQTTVVIRTDQAVHDPSWAVGSLGLEDVVLAYMAHPTGPEQATPALEVLR